jgi:hypothetical protein
LRYLRFAADYYFKILKFSLTKASWTHGCGEASIEL